MYIEFIIHTPNCSHVLTRATNPPGEFQDDSRLRLVFFLQIYIPIDKRVIFSCDSSYANFIVQTRAGYGRLWIDLEIFHLKKYSDILSYSVFYDGNGTRRRTYCEAPPIRVVNSYANGMVRCAIT